MSHRTALSLVACFTVLLSGGPSVAASPTPPMTCDAVAQGPRDALLYVDSTSVRVFRHHAVMGGFRFRGAYTRGRAPVMEVTARTASVVTDLGAQKKVRPENWYAIFAAANSDDVTAKLSVMPFLRVGKILDDRLILMPAGEGSPSTNVTAFYDWSSTDILAGNDILVVSENGNFSGRVTTITSNDQGSITLSKIDGISPGDFLLPAPPNAEHYVYLGTFYFDTAEVRNIYDSGNVVKSKMLRIPSGKNATNIDLTGYISPMATAAIIESSGGLSTSSQGEYVEYFDADGSNHVIDTRRALKTTRTTESYFFSNITIPFLRYQSFVHRTAGPLAPTRVQAGLQIVGWIEP